MKYFYLVVLIIFIIGGILISVINRNKDKETRKNSWIKYASYAIIVNIIIISILYNATYFYYVAIAISAVGLIEILRATYRSRKIFVGISTLAVFLMLAFIFILFSRSEQRILLFTYLVVTVFDAFSQLSGQLFGKTKLIPRISPNKTWEGLIGGLISTSLTAVLFAEIIGLSVVKTIALSVIISMFALFGDLLASFSKRKFNIKDFSNLLPGQGGFLDRFDSLIFAGVIVNILVYSGYI